MKQDSGAAWLWAPAQFDPLLAAGPVAWQLRPMEGEVDWALATHMLGRADADAAAEAGGFAACVQAMRQHRKAVNQGRAVWWGAYEGDRLMAHIGAFSPHPQQAVSHWLLLEACLAWSAWVPPIGASFLSMALAKLQSSHEAKHPVALLVKKNSLWQRAAQQAGFVAGEGIEAVHLDDPPSAG